MTDAALAIRHAATVILWRAGKTGPEVLMGQRGAGAVFMPNKVVFPGGAVDPGDGSVPFAGMPAEACLRRLACDARGATAAAVLGAAIRELWEETGLILGAPGDWDGAPADWAGFAAAGYRPDAGAFRYVFRAITPPGRPRRFDARFLVAPATAVAGDPDDFSRASEELSHLGWIPLARVREHDLPFVTELVLAEIGPLLGAEGPPESVPFIVNDDAVSGVSRLR